jgi:hypothetical protein
MPSAAILYGKRRPVLTLPIYVNTNFEEQNNSHHMTIRILCPQYYYMV